MSRNSEREGELQPGLPVVTCAGGIDKTAVMGRLLRTYSQSEMSGEKAERR
jgi:hypothetical protein